MNIEEKYVQTTFEQRGRTYCYMSGKVCYPTKTQAKKDRATKELKYGSNYRVYLCDDCNLFHLATTDSKWNKNK